MIIDFLNIIQWWFVLLAIGLTFYPLTFWIFRNFPDKGYALSKTLGLLLLGYCVWLLASFKILPFNNPTIYFVLTAFMFINGLVVHKKGLKGEMIRNWQIPALEEALFLIGLILWSFVRAHEPSINGIEKYMDFGFINSILRSEFFPPKDIWLAPGNINYYYFGHFLVALLTKISYLSQDFTYNLTVASLFALTFISSFSIGAALASLFWKAYAPLIAVGVITGFLVTLGGNLHPIYGFFKNYEPQNAPVPFWQLPLSLNFYNYRFPDATRFIPFTIHEFPAYSFVISDLHGHVLNIPFVLLLIALLVKIYLDDKISKRFLILYGLVIAVSLMTNFLDSFIYLLVFALVVFFKNLRAKKSIQALDRTIKLTGGVALASLIFSLPFWLEFRPFGQGIGVLCSPDFLVKLKSLGGFIFEPNHCGRSPLWMLAILYGLFFFTASGFVWFSLRKSGRRLFNLNQADFLALSLIFAAVVLILIPEIIYISDIYLNHYRANTMFKFGYQAFIILALVTPYMLVRILGKNPPLIYFLVTGFLLFLVFIYPVLATTTFYKNFQNYQTLDGLAYLTRRYPSDYEAVVWLRDNVRGQPVILEAVGDSYTDYARISSNTGIPTVLGWPIHETLWRGKTELVGERTVDIGKIYETSDLNLAQELLDKYQVKYVYVGVLEQQKYKNLEEKKFAQLGRVIFNHNKTTVYQVKDN